MNRVVGLVAAIVVAAVVAFFVMRQAPARDGAAGAVERLLAAGNLAGARTELASVRDHVDPATADYLEGAILLAEGDDAGAVKVLVRAQATRPDDWRIVSALAACLANSGRNPDAVASLEKYVTLAPGDERGIAMLARRLLDDRVGRPDPSRAIALLDRIEALPHRVAPEGDPTAVTSGQLRLIRTRALLQLGRNMDALIDARIGVRESPEVAEAWYLLGEAARIAKTGGARESVDAYRRALELAPGNRMYAEQFVNTSIDFEGDPREALGVTEMLLSRWTDDPRLLLLRARALVRNDRIEEANAIYGELLKRELPREVRLAVLRNRGILLYDWKVAGRESPYLDDAHQLLKRYVEEGGEMDAKLRPTWEALEERARERDGKK